MKKLFATMLAVVLLLACATGCRPDPGMVLPGATTSTLATEPTIDTFPTTLPQETFGPQPDGGIFNLNNVVRITFFSYYGQGIGSDVPAEHMQEIIDWLATFTLGEEAPEILPPGTNTVYVEIEYSYGTVFRTGMDTVDFAGTIYYIKGNEPPACYWEILEGTSLP
jgi:hypothetical protein